MHTTFPPRCQMTVLAAALCFTFPMTSAENITGNSGSTSFTGSTYELSGNITASMTYNYANNNKGIFSSSESTQTVSSTDDGLKITAKGGTVFLAKGNNHTIDFSQ